MVNETFARLHYPNGAIGRQVRTFTGPGTDWHTVVGVVPDIEDIDLGPSLIQGLYLPLSQRPNPSVNVVVRAQGDPLALAGTVRRVVADLDRNLPIYNVTTVQKYLDDATWGWRIFGTLFSVFGVAALFLATVGLYGVMAFSVSRRTQEIGVRMAVGAGAADVLRMVLRQGAWQVGPGDRRRPRRGRGAVQRHAADVLPGQPLRLAHLRRRGRAAARHRPGRGVRAAPVAPRV